MDQIRQTPSVRPHTDKLEIVVVEDMVKDGAFESVMNGVTRVIHIASRLSFEVGRRISIFLRSVNQP